MLKFVCLLAFAAACACEEYGGNEYYEAPETYPGEAQRYLEETEEPVLRVRRQLFGGRQNLGGGAFNQRVGFQSGSTWGSLSQSGSQLGRPSPITYSGGSAFGLPGGHSISGAFDHQPKFGSHANVRGTANLFSNDRHQVSAWAQHDRNFDRSFKPIGKETNSAGIDYGHRSGATAFLSGSKTPGSPSRGSVGGTVPIANLGSNAKLEAYGKTDFGHGMKPNHEGGVQLSASF